MVYRTYFYMLVGWSVCQERHTCLHRSLVSLFYWTEQKILLFSGNMSILKETLSTEIFLDLGLPYRVLLRSLNGCSLGNRRLQKQMSARHNWLFPPKRQSHSIC